MGMPAFVYRLAFGAFGVRCFKRGVLNLAGIRPVRCTLIGEVEKSQRARQRWLKVARELGRRGL
jgi:hypothetical protein